MAKTKSTAEDILLGEASNMPIPASLAAGKIAAIGKWSFKE